MLIAENVVFLECNGKINDNIIFHNKNLLVLNNKTQKVVEYLFSIAHCGVTKIRICSYNCDLDIWVNQKSNKVSVECHRYYGFYSSLHIDEDGNLIQYTIHLLNDIVDSIKFLN